MEIFNREMERAENRKRQMELYLQELEKTTGEESTIQERDAHRLEIALENNRRPIRRKGKPK